MLFLFLVPILNLEKHNQEAFLKKYTILTNLVVFTIAFTGCSNETYNTNKTIKLSCTIKTKCSSTPAKNPVTCTLGTYKTTEANECIAKSFLRNKIVNAKAYDLDCNNMICS